MYCSKCGKKLPDTAVKCSKCGYVIKDRPADAGAEPVKKQSKAELRAQAARQQKRDKAKPIIIWSVIAFVVIASVAGLLASGILFGHKKPQGTETKPESSSDIKYTYKEASDDTALFHIGNVPISTEEYEFFFRQSYSTVQNNAALGLKQYAMDQLGEAYDDNKDYYDDLFAEYAAKTPNVFDPRKPINNQTSKAKDADGKEMTWQAYIRQDALNALTDERVKYQLALDSGMKLTDDVKQQVYAHIEGLREAVVGSGGGYTSLTQYVKILFGDACDEEFFKNKLIREYMAKKYESATQQAKNLEYDNATVKAAYQKNSAQYDFADIYVYEVTGDKAKETAEKIRKETKDAETFTTAIQKYEGDTKDKTSLPVVPGYYLTQNFAKEMTTWVYDKARKTNDVNLFKTTNGYTVVVIQTPCYTKNGCISYREIVFNKTNSDGNAMTEEEIAETKAKAEEVYKEWKKSSKDEDSFTYFALANSQSSTAESGGLVSIATEDDQNEQIKAWAKQKPKPGDTTLLDCDDAFRIVYFVYNYNQYWNYAVRADKAAEDVTKTVDKAKKGTYATKTDDAKMNKADETMIVNINKIFLGIGA